MRRRWLVAGLVLAGLAGCGDVQKPAKVEEPIPAQRFPQKKTGAKAPAPLPAPK